MSAAADLVRRAEDEARLDRVYRRQQRMLRNLSIEVPPEQALFLEGAPLESKVAFYGWLIREAIR